MAIAQYDITPWREFTIPTNEGFTSGTIYTDPSSSEVRTQLQSQHSQMKKYVNETLVPAINNTYTKAETIEQINEAVFDSGNVTPVVVQGMIDTSIAGKQDTLVSGTNIKTINDESVLGDGNLTITGEFKGVDVTKPVGTPNVYDIHDEPFVAPVDCWVFCQTARSQPAWWIDGVQVFGTSGQTSTCPVFPLKAGQTLSTSAGSSTKVVVWEFK